MPFSDKAARSPGGIVKVIDAEDEAGTVVNVLKAGLASHGQRKTSHKDIQNNISSRVCCNINIISFSK